jgi:hypothetical protein
MSTMAAIVRPWFRQESVTPRSPSYPILLPSSARTFWYFSCAKSCSERTPWVRSKDVAILLWYVRSQASPEEEVYEADRALGFP